MDDVDLLARHKWVRIMCDFSADGVWDIEGRACYADDLPVSEELLTRLRAWQQHYDRWYPTPASEPGEYPPFDDLTFSREGLEIARAVKAELPDWTILYHDEAAWRPGASRETFEYEIG